MATKIIPSLFGILFCCQTFANANPCTEPNELIVQTAQHKLYICEQGIVVKKYKVSLGRQGLSKNQAGDNKTPLGLYNLGTPRKSRKFNYFIPIGYPTSQQAAMGYTGSDVGIHGPHWLFSWLGSLNSKLDWTQGCIAVGDNAEIDSIANWVKEHPQAKVLINS